MVLGPATGPSKLPCILPIHCITRKAGWFKKKWIRGGNVSVNPSMVDAEARRTKKPHSP
jgi:hypothetical protein